MEPRLLKYPRTQHLSGSELQRDDDPTTMPLRALRGQHLVVEEKLDGANAGVSFGAHGELQLQSRGHFLTGGPRERHFALFKTWAQCLQADLHDVLGRRYVMYGEWCYAKHTVFYDHLPHFFHEFDVLDRERGVFLSTPARRRLLEGLPITSVPVLHEGVAPDEASLLAMVRPSLYKSSTWRATLREAVDERGQSWAHVDAQTEDSDLAEGLYVKHEDSVQVLGRYKYVRPGFSQTLLGSESHWHSRPILPNQLAPGAELFPGGG